MPLWLQLTAAASAALAGGIMGAALVPYLQKMRICEPKTTKEGDAAEQRLRPTMGGLLLVFGTLLGLAVSYALYRTFSVVDNTSLSVQQETKEMFLAVCFAILCGIGGFARDWHIVKRRTIRRISPLLRFLAVFLLNVLFLLLCDMGETVLDFGFWKYDAGFLYVPLSAAMGTVLWMSAAAIEEETDGVCISTGGVLLLGMTVLLMQQSQNSHALLTLTAAGASIGCMPWNLHPAKCRIGNVGTFWMSGILTAVCLLSSQHLIMLLMAAPYLINLLPSWKKNSSTLQKQMCDIGMKPWQRIALLAGFAMFCSIVAVLA